MPLASTSPEPPFGDTPACYCTRPATCVVRIHHSVRWTRDRRVCSSIAMNELFVCPQCAGGIVASHAEPDASPITVTVTPLGG